MRPYQTAEDAREFASNNAYRALYRVGLVCKGKMPVWKMLRSLAQSAAWFAVSVEKWMSGTDSLFDAMMPWILK